MVRFLGALSWRADQRIARSVAVMEPLPAGMVPVEIARVAVGARLIPVVAMTVAIMRMVPVRVAVVIASVPAVSAPVSLGGARRERCRTKRRGGDECDSDGTFGYSFP